MKIVTEKCCAVVRLGIVVVEDDDDQNVEEGWVKLVLLPVLVQPHIDA